MQYKIEHMLEDIKTGESKVDHRELLELVYSYNHGTLGHSDAWFTITDTFGDEYQIEEFYDSAERYKELQNMKLRHAITIRNANARSARIMYGTLKELFYYLISDLKGSKRKTRYCRIKTILLKNRLKRINLL